MPTINFPSAPTLADQYTFSGKTWEWDGAGWFQVVATVGLGIQFQEEGSNLGTAGTADTFNVVGTNLTLSRTADVVTLTETLQAPKDAQYLTLATNATLTNERVVTAGNGITLTDAGAGSTLTIASTGSNVPWTVPGLLGWWKADALDGYTNGNSVYIWPNMAPSGDLVHFQGTANIPTYTAIAVNSLPALTFNGTTQCLTCTDNPLLSPATTTYVVLQVNSDNGLAKFDNIVAVAA